jgi:hypothetical protein
LRYVCLSSAFPCDPTVTLTVAQEPQPEPRHSQVDLPQPHHYSSLRQIPPHAHTYSRLMLSSSRSRARVRRVCPARRKPLLRYGNCCQNIFKFPVIPEPAARRRPLPRHDLHQGTQGRLQNQAGLLSGPDKQALLGRSWLLRRYGENTCCSRSTVDRLIASAYRFLQRKIHLQGPLEVYKIKNRLRTQLEARFSSAGNALILEKRTFFRS